MIITCNNCNKNFDLDSSFIPEIGRLLQCSSCNYKWFFKKEIIKKPHSTIQMIKPTEEPELFKEEAEAFKEKIEPLETKNPETIELLDTSPKDVFLKDEILIKKENKVQKDKKNYDILSLTIVFIISFIALIIVLDTFQKPVSKIVPNIEFLLYSLYETIDDITLFLIDLI